MEFFKRNNARTLLVILSFLLAAQSSRAALKAFLNYAAFTSPQTGSYVETYLTIVGQSIIYKNNANGKLQGAVNVSLLFMQHDSIKAVKKYKLHSPEVTDTTLAKVNFIDEQRIVLPNGVYDFEIQIADEYVNTVPFKANQKVTVDFPSDKISLSDIEFLESYSKSKEQTVLTKSGYELVPYVSDLYPDNLNKLSFYCEGYKTKQVLGEDRVVLNYYIESAETKAQMNDFGSFSVQKTNEINVLLSSFNISNLPSGNYNMVVDIKDKTNKLLATKRKLFIRKNVKAKLNLGDLSAVNTSNTFAANFSNRDTLMDHIRSMRPIATSPEKTFIDENLKTTSVQLLQQFFFNFWKTRNESNPEGEWRKYYTEVKKVNNSFTCLHIKGYETERGRVYLQYGPPDNRIVGNNEQASYPYEMWQYFKMEKQVNKVFVFYNPDFVSCNYRLIHSDALGELSNPNWMSLVQRDNGVDYYNNNNINQDYLNSK